MENHELTRFGNFKLPFRLIPAIISFATFVIILLIPHPESLTSKAWLMLAIFVASIVAIITKTSSVGVVSVIGMCLVAVLRASTPVKGPDGELVSVGVKEAIQATLASFSNDLIWLIVIAVILSRGIIKTHLGERIGYFFITLFGKRSLGIGYALAFCETILAPLTPSNTARGGAIIHPIMKSIALAFGSDPETKTENKIGKYLALVNYHANPISSAMFVTATAPNPLALEYINQVAGTSFHLTWGTWALSLFLPAFVAMMLMPLVLYKIFPPEIKVTPDAQKFAKSKMHDLGPISLNEKIMISIFILLLLLWADVPGMLFGSMFSFNPTTVALIGLTLLILTGILTWDEILAQKSAWDTLIWFGALVMMAGELNKHGVISWFSDSFQSWLITMHLNSLAVFFILVLVFLYSHYFFASTTAHVSAMFLAFLMVGVKVVEPALLIPFYLMMAGASTLMMSLTHYATGTSPIIFGSGFVSMGEWWKAGFIMSVVNMIVFTVVGFLWWKVLGYY